MEMLLKAVATGGPVGASEAPALTRRTPPKLPTPSTPRWLHGMPSSRCTRPLAPPASSNCKELHKATVEHREAEAAAKKLEDEMKAAKEADGSTARRGRQVESSKGCFQKAKLEAEAEAARKSAPPL